MKQSKSLKILKVHSRGDSSVNNKSPEEQITAPALKLLGRGGASPDIAQHPPERPGAAFYPGQILTANENDEIERINLLTVDKLKRPGAQVFGTRAQMWGALRARRAETEARRARRPPSGAAPPPNPQALEQFLWQNGREAAPAQQAGGGVRLLGRRRARAQRLYTQDARVKLDGLPPPASEGSASSSESGISEWGSDEEGAALGRLLRRLGGEGGGKPPPPPPAVERRPACSSSSPPAAAPAPAPPAPAPAPQPAVYYVPQPAPAPAPAPPVPLRTSEAPTLMSEVKEKIIYVKVADKCIQTKLRGRRPSRPAPSPDTAPKIFKEMDKSEEEEEEEEEEQVSAIPSDGPLPQVPPAAFPGGGGGGRLHVRAARARPVRDAAAGQGPAVWARRRRPAAGGPVVMLQMDGEGIEASGSQQDFIGMVDFEDPEESSDSQDEVGRETPHQFTVAGVKIRRGSGSLVGGTAGHVGVEVDYLSEDDAGSPHALSEDESEDGALAAGLGLVGRALGRADRRAGDLGRGLDQVNERLRAMHLDAAARVAEADRDLAAAAARPARKGYNWLSRRYGGEETRGEEDVPVYSEEDGPTLHGLSSIMKHQSRNPSAAGVEGDIFGPSLQASPVTSPKKTPARLSSQCRDMSSQLGESAFASERAAEDELLAARDVLKEIETELANLQHQQPGQLNNNTDAKRRNPRPSNPFFDRQKKEMGLSSKASLQRKGVKQMKKKPSWN